ncbi:helix-turn-helix domain-containing protein [Sphingomonas ginsenosidivorax]|uniref:Helix-turn-helix domain-containing protein n=1 Tax=Sphingomonas ginsenosidivorax TaxID=862135 RepID=A0A5C6U9A1_9SPHN|nr:helix-turn-helix domain-containing protein [Sphingomonas ginsenosidivorax]TXC69607.1 helix-turn-helix domain-containing protein [Sphingomonas ginsenosidivorax]
MTETVFLTEAGAAKYLRLSQATLSRWRSIGSRGPAYRKFGGAVRYAKADLDHYADNAGVQQ